MHLGESLRILFVKYFDANYEYLYAINDIRAIYTLRRYRVARSYGRGLNAAFADYQGILMAFHDTQQM